MDPVGIELTTSRLRQHCQLSREREILSLSAFLRTKGHRGPYSPYKPCNHNLYIGIIIFPHIDNPQSIQHDRFMPLKLCHTCLLLIPMLWHRQVIFQSKGDMSSSAECRIRSREVWDTKSPADWIPTHKPTELLRIKQKLKLNSPSLWVNIQPTWLQCRQEPKILPLEK